MEEILKTNREMADELGISKPVTVTTRKPTPEEIAAHQFKHSAMRTGISPGIEPPLRGYFLRYVKPPASQMADES